MSARSEEQIAIEIYDLYLKKKDLDEEVKEVKEKYDAAFTEMELKLLESGKKSSGMFENIGEFTLSEKSFLSVPKHKSMEFINWLDQKGDAALAPRAFNPRTITKHLGDISTRVSETVDTMIEEGKGEEEIVSLCLSEFACASPSLEKEMKVSISETIEDNGGLLECPGNLIVNACLKKVGVSSFFERKISFGKKGKAK